jgi:hypothetical protein
MSALAKSIRLGLFGAAVATSLAFGASQAVAAPARLTCTGEGQIWLGTCPSSNCNSYCGAYNNLGICRNGCCTCAL